MARDKTRPLHLCHQCFLGIRSTHHPQRQALPRFSYRHSRECWRIRKYQSERLGFLCQHSQWYCQITASSCLLSTHPWPTEQWTYLSRVSLDINSLLQPLDHVFRKICCQLSLDVPHQTTLTVTYTLCLHVTEAWGFEFHPIQQKGNNYPPNGSHQHLKITSLPKTVTMAIWNHQWPAAREVKDQTTKPEAGPKRSQPDPHAATRQASKGISSI